MMARGDIYAIGDVQGCFYSLEALVRSLPLREADRIWLCGDLVNRGPKSLEVLRWARAEAERVQIVLGNHDLHLLAAAAGARTPKKRDTLQAVLRAPDCEELLGWLAQQPLVHCEGEHLMVHAGLHPSWDDDTARVIAAECSQAIANGTWLSAWKASRPAPPPWSSVLTGDARLAAALSILVGARTLYADNRLNVDYSGPPSGAPAGSAPWFTRSSSDSTIVFGHWAALGLQVGTRHLGPDTGCVWGGELTAMRLRDRALFQQPALESRKAMG